MDGYTQRSFQAPLSEGPSVTHDVYERGEGPPVVLVQELPGIGPETLRLADRLVAAGHRVVLPHLFGPLGRVSILGNLGRVFCMRRELQLLARNRSSPIVEWLRALCRDVRDQRGVRGVGVIGMCLTGNFAITLMADDSVLAAVASQPSLPPAPLRGLHMSASEIQAARVGLTAKGSMLAFRFAGDRLCTAKKFAALASAFNDGEERIRLVTLPGPGHSVLTLDFVDEQGHPTREALEAVLEYFGRRLGR
jgi:dienelactone hydrolase